MTTLRWGILSTADIGMQKVTPAIQAAANADVVAYVQYRSLYPALRSSFTGLSALEA